MFSIAMMWISNSLFPVLYSLVVLSGGTKEQGYDLLWSRTRLLWRRLD